MNTREYEWRRILGELQRCHCFCALNKNGFCTDKTERVHPDKIVILCSNKDRWLVRREDRYDRISTEKRKKSIKGMDRMHTYSETTGEETLDI